MMMALLKMVQAWFSLGGVLSHLAEYALENTLNCNSVRDSRIKRVT